MKHLLFSLLSFVCTVVYAQNDYTPMLKDGRRWCYRYDYWSPTIDETTNPHLSWMTVIGDSVYEGRKYKTILHETIGLDGSIVGAENYWNYNFAWEEDKKLYYYMVWDGPEAVNIECLRITFDTENDRFVNMGYQLVEDSIEVKGHSYRRLTYERPAIVESMPDELKIYVVKVEGIGISESYWEPSGDRNRYSDRFVNCYDGDELIFEYDDFFVEGKTPTKIVSPARGNNEPNDQTVYNMLGIKVSNPRPGQIVIKGGKKIIAK